MRAPLRPEYNQICMQVPDLERTGCRNLAQGGRTIFTNGRSRYDSCRSHHANRSRALVNGFVRADVHHPRPTTATTLLVFLYELTCTTLCCPDLGWVYHPIKRHGRPTVTSPPSGQLFSQTQRRLEAHAMAGFPHASTACATVTLDQESFFPFCCCFS